MAVVAPRPALESNSTRERYDKTAMKIRFGTKAETCEIQFLSPRVLCLFLQEYDYVFDVDIQEGKPSLKLPYNITEDPWMAAHNFLERNNISQMFLDQVANFIVEQTKGVTLGQAPAGVTDPFTGASRYVPGSGNSAGAGGTGTDPFTGAGRYVPGSGAAPPSNPSTEGLTHGADPFTGWGTSLLKTTTKASFPFQ